MHTRYRTLGNADAHKVLTHTGMHTRYISHTPGKADAHKVSPHVWQNYPILFSTQNARARVCVCVCRLQMCKREYNGHIMAATASVSLRQTFTNSIILTLHPIFYYICNICTLAIPSLHSGLRFASPPTHRLKEAFT